LAGSSAEGDLSDLCPKDVIVPEGFELQGGTRKFIVLRQGGALVVAIGPLYANGNWYYHKKIAGAGENAGTAGISGGGQVDFTGTDRDGSVHWEAKFSGSSGDFGVFDPMILTEESRVRIADEMGMKVSFSWDR
jgi:hypothetical protein